MFKNKFLNNTSWILGGKIFQMVISLLISTLTARYLGPSNYGIINYTNSYIAFFASVCTLGLNGIIVKEFVCNREKEGEIIGTVIVMRLCSSIVSMIMIGLLIKQISGGDSLIVKVAMLQSVNIIFASFDTINFWYQSKLMSKVSTIIQSIAYIVMTLYRIIILILGKDVTWFAFAVSLDTMIVGILLFISYQKNKSVPIRFSKKWIKILLKQSAPFIISEIMITVYGHMDKIMIGAMLDQTSVGLYATAVTITGLWNFIPVAFLDSARPVIMEEKLKNEQQYIKRLKQLYAFIIWLSFAYALCMTIVSKYVILILYGKAYLGARDALVIVVWYCAFSYLGAAKNIWIICEKKVKYEMIFTILGAIANISLNFVLIPQWGIVGAAVATLLTQIFTNFIVMALFKETRLNARLIVEAICLKDVIDVKMLKQRFKNKF